MLKTPMWIIDRLRPFSLDPCAGTDTFIGGVNYRLEHGEDDLKMEWHGFVWCNPPYSQKELWADKMVRHGDGILILPERGSAPWFGPLAQNAGCYFVMGKKINFEGGPSSNNMGSVLFPFGEEAKKRIEKSGLPGHMVRVEWFTNRKNSSL